MKTKLLFPAMLIGGFLSGCATHPPLGTVSRVDLKRYSGTWHEVARYPNWFQKDCASDVVATYTPKADGSIAVTNSCRKHNGAVKQITGSAKVVPGTGGAKLKVTFFAPFAADYWIIGLDEKNYSWAVVGHPSRKYLWILARKPALPKETYGQILQLVRERGYEPDKLIVSEPQRKG